MTTIVGIFDNTRDMEQAVVRLAEAGLEDAIYDDAILAQETENVGPIVASGAAQPVLARSVRPDSPSKPNIDTIIRAFKRHLANYHLPSDVINAYATTFLHGGKFILVKADPQRSEQVIAILRQCGASRVTLHD
jgi:hypothetical protein